MNTWKDFLTVKTLAASAVVVSLLIVAVVFLTDSSSSMNAGSSSFTSSEAPSVAGPSSAAPATTEEPAIPASDNLYDSCAEVWQALGRPLTEQDEGYPDFKPNVFDGDSDGIGCEDNPLTEQNEASIDWSAVWEQTQGNAQEFGQWAAPKLKDFWQTVAVPGVANVWEQLQDSW